MEGRAAQLALQAMDQAKRDQLQSLKTTLFSQSTITFDSFVNDQKGHHSNLSTSDKRKKVTDCFAGLLAFSQAGECELVQKQQISSGNKMKF